MYQQYLQHLQQISDLGAAISLLHWDQETYLPKKGAADRGRQIATLSGMAHEMSTAPEYIKMVNELYEQQEELTADQRRNVALSHYELKRSQALDTEFVVKMSGLVNQAFHAWTAAKKASDFSQFAPALEALVDIKRAAADRYGYEDHPYDALMEEFEPGARVADLDVLFKEVKENLVDFAAQLRQKPQLSNACLHQHFDYNNQWAFGLEVLKHMGYDMEAGRQDVSMHPFTINFSPLDVRVTTRVDEAYFGSMTWSCIHEGGHALYEQGIHPEEFGQPIGRFISLGIHESQSRLWENHVGRGRAFWQHLYPSLQARFPKQLGQASLDDFYQAINRIEPHLIRVESDELNYHFHILIRYELEKALMEGSLKVKDLPEAWNAKYKAYLGLEVPDAGQGVLQDVHWGHGSFGYFPTYSLGSFYAAQFYAQAQKDLPDLETQIAGGDCSNLLSWLRTNIHEVGRRYEAKELCERVTGAPLKFEYFMQYAREKYGALYGL